MLIPREQLELLFPYDTGLEGRVLSVLSGFVWSSSNRIWESLIIWEVKSVIPVWKLRSAFSQLWFCRSFHSSSRTFLWNRLTLLLPRCLGGFHISSLELCGSIAMLRDLRWRLHEMVLECTSTPLTYSRVEQSHPTCLCWQPNYARESFGRVARCPTTFQKCFTTDWISVLRDIFRYSFIKVGT